MVLQIFRDVNDVEMDQFRGNMFKSIVTEMIYNMIDGRMRLDQERFEMYCKTRFCLTFDDKDLQSKEIQKLQDKQLRMSQMLNITANAVDGFFANPIGFIWSIYWNKFINFRIRLKNNIIGKYRIIPGVLQKTGVNYHGKIKDCLRRLRIHFKRNPRNDTGGNG